MSNGDLDGDMYLIIYEPMIVSHISTINIQKPQTVKIKDNIINHK